MQQNIYDNPGTPATFKSSGGTVTFTPSATPLASGNGRVSNQWDRGAGAQPAKYKWRAQTRWAATAAAGDQLRIYLVTSDGTYVDGGVATTDQDLSSETALSANCQQVGAIRSTGASQVEISSGVCYIDDRYVNLVFWNGSATKALTATASDHFFSLTPIPDAIQTLA